MSDSAHQRFDGKGLHCTASDSNTLSQLSQSTVSLHAAWPCFISASGHDLSVLSMIAAMQIIEREKARQVRVWPLPPAAVLAPSHMVHREPQRRLRCLP
eukprot:6033340-Pleurochrysis_carterae.AAC.2